MFSNTTPAYRAAAQSYDGEYTLTDSSWRRFPVVLEGMLLTKWLIETMYGQIRCVNCGEQPDKWIYATLAVRQSQALHHLLTVVNRRIVH